MGTGAARWAGTNQRFLRIQLAGPISAYILMAATTGNLAGPTTIRRLLFRTDVRFMGVGQRDHLHRGNG